MSKQKRSLYLPSAFACFSLAVFLSVANLSFGPFSKSIFRLLEVAQDEERGLQHAEMDVIERFRRAALSIVFIDVYNKRPALNGKRQIEGLLSLGSGYVWNKNGYIVTNYHVVQGSEVAMVSILTKTNVDDANEKLLPTSNYGHHPSMDGYHWRVIQAKIVGVDAGSDVALLKIDAPEDELVPIKQGSVKGLQVGQTVYAIGNPYGLDHSLSHGIVSALNRHYKAPDGNIVQGCIQTDAAINPGNSGGILIDTSGRFVGMNTAGYTESGGSDGVGIAINADYVRMIVNQLMKNGTIKRLTLGATMMDSVQTYLGIKEGVLLLEVIEGGPAAKAGLKGTIVNEITGAISLGDVITVLGNTEIQTEIDVLEVLENCKPNEIVKVKFIRYTKQGIQLKKETVVQLV